MNNKKNNKIIGIGWQKTGTTTLEIMLEQLGYAVCNYDMGFIKPAIDGDIEKLFGIATRWDAMSDMPWFLYYKELDQYFPNSKFILTIRDEKSWLNSLLGHFGESEKNSIKRLYGDKLPINNQAEVVHIYRQHNQAVKEYFKERSNDLLVLDWNDSGWKELCDFLDLNIPKYRFSGKLLALPKANTKIKRTKKHNLFYYRFLLNSKNIIRNKSIDLFGFWLVSLYNYLRFLWKQLLILINKCKIVR